MHAVPKKENLGQDNLVFVVSISGNENGKEYIWRTRNGCYLKDFINRDVHL